VCTAPWLGSHRAFSSAAQSSRRMDLAGAAMRLVACLATLVTAVIHPHSRTLRKAFPADLHQVSDVATSHDDVEACFMQRAPLPGVGFMVAPMGLPAPALLPAAVACPASIARGFSRACLLTFFFAAASAGPRGANASGAGARRPC
jgi:hypothetical protein